MRPCPCPQGCGELVPPLLVADHCAWCLARPVVACSVSNASASASTSGVGRGVGNDMESSSRAADGGVSPAGACSAPLRDWLEGDAASAAGAIIRASLWWRERSRVTVERAHAAWEAFSACERSSTTAISASTTNETDGTEPGGPRQARPSRAAAVRGALAAWEDALRAAAAGRSRNQPGAALIEAVAELRALGSTQGDAAAPDPADYGMGAREAGREVPLQTRESAPQRLRGHKPSCVTVGVVQASLSLAPRWRRGPLRQRACSSHGHTPLTWAVAVGDLRLARGLVGMLPRAELSVRACNQLHRFIGFSPRRRARHRPRVRRPRAASVPRHCVWRARAGTQPWRSCCWLLVWTPTRSRSAASA